MLVACEGSAPTIHAGPNESSYVRKTWRLTSQSPKTYLLGPAALSMAGWQRAIVNTGIGILGSKLLGPLGGAAARAGAQAINGNRTIRTIADAAVSFIRQNSGPVFLVGWSRGAAACVQVALDLHRSGSRVQIEAMFLFDAVDQDSSTGDFLNYIPENVKNAYHAIATKKEGIWKWVFPTCARNAHSSVNLVYQEFAVTHGEIAGTGGGDGGSWDWMSQHMRRHRVIG